MTVARGSGSAGGRPPRPVPRITPLTFVGRSNPFFRLLSVREIPVSLDEDQNVASEAGMIAPERGPRGPRGG